MQAKAELTRPAGNEFVRSALSPDGWNASILQVEVLHKGLPLPERIRIIGGGILKFPYIPD